LQLAQKIGGHLNDLRGTEEPLQLAVVLDFLRQVTSAINPQGDIRPWDIIGMFVTRLSTDLNSLLPRIQSAVEEGHLLQSRWRPKSIPVSIIDPLSSSPLAGLAGPWVLRADTLRSDVAANAEAETQIASQSEQITSLMREVKLRVCLEASLVPAASHR
jgi:dynactin 1